MSSIRHWWWSYEVIDEQVKAEMTMGVFFDTEFTTLGEKGFLALISIGLVSADGREFYAELIDTWQKGMCSTFVIDTVLPLLDGGECRMTEAQLAIRLKEWIENLDCEKVVLRSDAPTYDWSWVAELFQFYGCWPRNLRKKCGMVYFRLPRHQVRYDNALDDYWQEHGDRRHHALVDARSLQYAWNSAIRREI